MLYFYFLKSQDGTNYIYNNQNLFARKLTSFDNILSSIFMMKNKNIDNDLFHIKELNKQSKKIKKKLR